MIVPAGKLNGRRHRKTSIVIYDHPFAQTSEQVSHNRQCFHSNKTARAGFSSYPTVIFCSA